MIEESSVKKPLLSKQKLTKLRIDGDVHTLSVPRDLRLTPKHQIAPWNLKARILNAIKEQGGFVSCHAHFDKAFYITQNGLNQSMVDMETKWQMSDDIKRQSTQEEIEDRIRNALDMLVAQGCTRTCTFVDAYEAVDHRAIDAALVVKEEYKDAIDLLVATQPIGGLLDRDARALYETVTEKADIVGGLPSRDRPNDDESYNALFSIARRLNKPIHVHIDQENNPDERDSEKLIRAVKKHGYEGRVVAIHALSISAQPKQYRQKIYKEFANLGIAVVVCPSAAIAMKQLDHHVAPVHNSIANVSEMLEAGVLVGLGVDNVYDFYQPFVDGDMWVELRMLMEACRFYDFDALVDIATVNGRKLLNYS